MNKILITILVIFLLVGTVIGTNFATKGEALSFFDTSKTERESDVKDVISSITFTTDKICEIEYYSERIQCKVCYEYTIERITRPACVTLQEGSTLAEDQEIINEMVNIEIESRYPIDPVTYKERDMEGDSLTITEI